MHQWSKIGWKIEGEKLKKNSWKDEMKSIGKKNNDFKKIIKRRIWKKWSKKKMYLKWNKSQVEWIISSKNDCEEIWKINNNFGE